MTVMKITVAGGIMPSIKPRSLPDNAAQTAENLLARVPQFRPLKSDATVATSGVANPKTLYRLARTSGGAFNIDMTTGWVVNANVINYVKGQLDDDATERTYYTRADGGAAPRVLDATGQDRQLGVPKPTVAVNATLTVVDETTPDERTAGISTGLQQVVTAIQNAMTFTYSGYTHPGTGTTGLLDQTATLASPDRNPRLLLRGFRLSTIDGANGTITNTYGNMPLDQVSWVFDPGLWGYQTGYLASDPAWGGGYDHWWVPFWAYGKTISFNSAAASAAISAIPMPGLTDGTPLFSSTQVSDLVSAVAADVDPTGAAMKPLIDALAAKAADLVALYNGTASVTQKAQIEAFYVTHAAEITNAVAACAESLWEIAAAIATAKSATTDYPGGPF